MDTTFMNDDSKEDVRGAFDKIKAIHAERQKGLKNFKKFMNKKFYNVPCEDKQFDDGVDASSFEVYSSDPLERLRNLMSYRRNPPPFAILSREHVLNDYAIPAKYFTQPENDYKESEDSYFDATSDGVLIKVFSFLAMKHLLKASRVCKRWRRLAFDMSLWAKVDLQPYRKSLPESRLVEIIKNIFLGKTRQLSLKDFRITQPVLQELAKCKTLKSLNLDGCTFVGKFKALPTERPFPTGLRELSLRSTKGESSVLKLITPTLTTVKTLKIEKCFYEELHGLEEMVKFLPELRRLYVNSGLQFSENNVKALAKHCKSLQSLAIMRALDWQGEGLDTLVNECSELEELHLHMTGVTDYYLGQVAWENTSLTKVTISLTRNVSSAALKSMLCKLKYLGHLKLSSGCDGFAIDDGLLAALAASDLSYLKHLHIDHSRVLTNEGILNFLRLKALSSLHLTNCSMITPSIRAKLVNFGSVAIYIMFARCFQREGHFSPNEAFFMNRVNYNFFMPS